VRHLNFELIISSKSQNIFLYKDRALDITTMAVTSHSPDVSFPLKWEDTDEDTSLQAISETSIINLLVGRIHPRRRAIAKKQISHLIRKIALYPEKRMVYITFIKELIEFEKKQYGVKNE
jgi:hypothetical protein